MSDDDKGVDEEISVAIPVDEPGCPEKPMYTLQDEDLAHALEVMECIRTMDNSFRSRKTPLFRAAYQRATRIYESRYDDYMTFPHSVRRDERSSRCLSRL